MNIERIKNLIRAFYPFAKQKLSFEEPVKIKYITNDVGNWNDPFGKTAYYNPQEKCVTLFILNRHPKDILRSFAHELTHHAQHCRGDISQDVSTGEGYAQKDPHMRSMEEEAYMEGGMLVRDWTDTLQEREKQMLLENEDKQHKDVERTKKTLRDNEEIVDMFEERRNRLNKKLMDKFIKPTKKEGNIE
jgi:hypothetical protein